VLPAGTSFDVRVNEDLSSESTQQGQRFTGTLETDVVDDSGQIVVPRGAQVEGHVIDVKPSGRISDSGELELTINTLRYGSHVAGVTTQPFLVKGESHTKSNATKVGGGAVLGAIIGGIAGGGKGAAIGATVGAGAGAAGAAATGKKPAEVNSEAVIHFLSSTETRLARASAYEIQHPDNGIESQSSSTTQSSTQPSIESGAQSSGVSHPPPATSSTSSSSSSSSSSDDGEPQLRRRPAANSSETQTAQDQQPAVPADSRSRRPNDSRIQTSANPTPGSDQFAFSARDRRSVNTCLNEHADQVPSNMTSHNTALDNPALVKGGTLPADLARKVRSLPLACELQLGALPNNYERVLYNGQVFLLDDNGYHILDVFNLDSY
jgi:hypothetical protein